MKKLSIYLLMLGCITTNTHLQYAATPIETPTKTHIKLESSVIHTVDGAALGINGDVVRLIMCVRREINIQLFGKHTKDGSYTGIYAFEGKNYSVQDLVALEDEIREGTYPAKRQQLSHLLETAKADFINQVHPFMEHARSTKRIMLSLIEESCAKRDVKDDSLIRQWAALKTEAEEIELFNHEIHSFRLFNKFCCDLLNFLGDLVFSCPKAVNQFKQSCEKRDKVLSLIPKVVEVRNIKIEAREKLQHDFAHYVFVEHINKLNLDEITPLKLETLLQEFEKKQS